jgi:3-oxoacyl-[acyl-carrier protein] reductase
MHVQEPPDSDTSLGGVVVTGGAQGLGRAMCARLTADGYRVVSVDLQPAKADTEAAYASVVGDARDVSVLREACRLAAEHPRGLVGFVANAGIARYGDSASLPRSDWDAVIDVDLSSVFQGAQVAAEHFDADGSIVVISSAAALGGVPLRAAYCAAKAGSLGLVRALSTEWGPRGIRVNGIAPGVVETELIRQARLTGSMRSADEMSSAVPLRRLGEPADIAAVVSFLLSSDSRYVTGATIPVDGGLSSQLGPLV